MAEIQLKNIRKSYDDEHIVVNDFSLDIQDKEFIVLVGPSGCGKSTTLRMIAGLEEITDGDLFIGEQRVNDVAPKDRDIAMVFQNYALYPHMSVYDNMAFGLKLRKMPKVDIDTRVKNAAEILGLTDFLKRKPKALSGGQRQRVALGRAIVRDAKVFLMDEPLSNLDAKLRVHMRAEIIKLHQRLQTTTIYVTHDQTEALTMATRIVIMNGGDAMQIGTPKEVYDRPDNTFVASFIGSPAMNFFKATIENDSVHVGGKMLKIPAEQLKSLEKKGYVGKEVIFGLRPEDIYEQSSFEGNEPALFTALVTVSELLGSEIMLYSDLEGQEFVAKINSRLDVEMNKNMDFAIDMKKAHFFDPITENRIN